MIAAHVRVDSFSAEEWIRLRRLLLPVSPAGAAAGQGKDGRREGSPLLTPPLFVLLEDGKVVKVLRPLAPAGRTEEDVARYAAAWRGPSSLPALRKLAGARVAAAVETETALRLVAAIDRDLGRDLLREPGRDPAREPGRATSVRMDFVEQLLVAGRASRAELGRGLYLDPELLGRLPIPSYAALQQTLDALLPDDRAAALFVFEDRRGRPPGLYASVILEKRAGHVVRMTSHRALELTPREFQGGRHKPLLDAIERRVARPHVALFCTLSAFRDIAGPDVGALARQVALRGAVIDPVPPWLLALTGIGAAASVAQGASKLFGRFVPDGIKQTARAITQTPFAALGFDPIALYAELRKLL